MPATERVVVTDKVKEIRYSGRTYRSGDEIPMAVRDARLLKRLGRVADAPGAATPLTHAPVETPAPAPKQRRTPTAPAEVTEARDMDADGADTDEAKRGRYARTDMRAQD